MFVTRRKACIVMLIVTWFGPIERDPALAPTWFELDLCLQVGSVDEEADEISLDS